MAGKGDTDSRSPDFQKRRESWERIFGLKKICKNCGKEFQSHYEEFVYCKPCGMKRYQDTMERIDLGRKGD